MKLQLLSDFHLESESFEPTPAPGAEVLVLAGDIDSSWQGLRRFARWPVPVLFVPGNHEFDGREFSQALPQLRHFCDSLGIRLLHRETCILQSAAGLRVRFVGATRWGDFELFGPTGRERAMRAGRYFVTLMQAQYHGQPFDAACVRTEGLACRAFLEHTLGESPDGRWDRCVVISHFAPSLRSADPRYGQAPSTASFCNADDELIALSDLWLHGHLHCRHDYRVARPDGRSARVVCQARGLGKKGEPQGFDPLRLLEL